MAKYKLPEKTCGQCIHEHACRAWNIGHLHNTDASTCINYETVRDSSAYYIGYLEGKKEGKEKPDMTIKKLACDHVAVRCSHRRNSKTYVLDPELYDPVFVVKAGTQIVPLPDDDVVVDQEGNELAATGRYYRTVETIDPYHAVLDIF